MAQRRFPPPWIVEEQEACFVVCDRDGQQWNLGHLLCLLSGVKRTSRGLGSMSAFDPKRTLATRFCCDAQPLPLAEEIAAALPLSCDDAAMNFLQQRNALVLHASKCVIPTLHDPTARSV